MIPNLKLSSSGTPKHVNIQDLATTGKLQKTQYIYLYVVVEPRVYECFSFSFTKAKAELLCQAGITSQTPETVQQSNCFLVLPLPCYTFTSKKFMKDL